MFPVNVWSGSLAESIHVRLSADLAMSLVDLTMSACPLIRKLVCQFLSYLDDPFPKVVFLF